MLASSLRMVALCGCLAGALPAAAELDPDTVRDLERRVEKLEGEDSASGPSSAGSWLSEWSRRIRLGGSANTGYYDGAANSVLHGVGPQVRDARFFLDAEVGEDLRLFDRTILRNVGMSFEWDLVRIGQLRNTVGELYVDLQGIAGSGWLNLQLGRFQIPVGEAYLRYSRGFVENPFISNPVAGTWWWDEGVKLYGASQDDRFSYVASISQGETAFNSSVSSQKQYTLKLISDPLPWLRLSASGLYSGAIGSDQNAGSGGALWIGELWAVPLEGTAATPLFVDGVQTPSGPQRTDRTFFVGADAIVDLPKRLRLWLAYGLYDIDQSGEIYDRRLHSWIAELVLRGGMITPALDTIYLGMRASGVGTYRGGRGYLLDFRHRGAYGFNMESLADCSVVLGWRPIRFLTLRAEYTHRRVSLVEGVGADMQRRAEDLHTWGIEIGVGF